MNGFDSLAILNQISLVVFRILRIVDHFESASKVKKVKSLEGGSHLDQVVHCFEVVTGAADVRPCVDVQANNLGVVLSSNCLGSIHRAHSQAKLGLFPSD